MRAVDDGSPPPELQFAWLCLRWNALPSEMEQQDYTTMKRLTAVLNAYDAVYTMRNAKGKEIHNLPRSAGRILAALQEAGVGLGLSG